MKVLIKFYRFTNIYDLRFFDNETTTLFFIFLFIYLFIYLFIEICTEEHFASYIFSIEGNIKTSILLILLKCFVVGYSNGNESFTGRLFSTDGLLNKLFHFFQYLIYSAFHDTFVKRFIKKLSFLSSNSKINISRCSILQKIRIPTL